MRNITFFLVSLFILAACSEKQATAWEDKSPEQQQKELSFISKCHTRHYKNKDFEACNAEFEKEFGYPYNGAGTQTK